MGYRRCLRFCFSYTQQAAMGYDSSTIKGFRLCCEDVFFSCNRQQPIKAVGEYVCGLRRGTTTTSCSFTSSHNSPHGVGQPAICFVLTLEGVIMPFLVVPHRSPLPRLPCLGGLGRAQCTACSCYRRRCSAAAGCC